MPCGVPQGSVLGPLLFIIYTNDLPNCLQYSKAILFADDTTVYSSSKNTQYLYKSANTDLQSLAEWFRANILSFKCWKNQLHKNNIDIPNNLSLQVMTQLIDKNVVHG